MSLPDQDSLARRKDEIASLLSDPAVLSNPQKIKDLSIEFSRLEKQLNNPPSDSKTTSGAILEIRAGVGGDEAAIFARELFDMYSRFGAKKGWKIEILTLSRSESGGYKEITADVSGWDAYKLMSRESGVHRVQRIPVTEKSGRIHTSTASVAVLSQVDDAEIELKPQDIKIEFFRSSGPGGQNVNKVETAVRIRHIPTGLTVASQESRSQQKNRDTAMKVLRAKLAEAKHETENKKIASERREQIGTADRSEKIRTYNFPQDRLTDHRLKKSWHNLPSIMEGNIDMIMATAAQEKKSE